MLPWTETGLPGEQEPYTFSSVNLSFVNWICRAPAPGPKRVEEARFPLLSNSIIYSLHFGASSRLFSSFLVVSVNLPSQSPYERVTDLLIIQEKDLGLRSKAPCSWSMAPKWDNWDLDCGPSDTEVCVSFHYIPLYSPALHSIIRTATDGSAVESKQNWWF